MLSFSKISSFYNFTISRTYHTLRIIHCRYIYIYLKNVFVRTYFSFYLILKNNTLLIALLSLKHTHKSRHQMMPTNFFPSRITNIHNQSLPQFQTSILIYILIDRGKVCKYFEIRRNLIIIFFDKKCIIFTLLIHIFCKCI